MKGPLTKGAWVDGLAEWIDGDTMYLSIAFTWRLKEARDRCLFAKALGYRVKAGGPATFRPSGFLADVAELGGKIEDAVRFHNPMATIASRGCPVNCWFCIVPKMHGTTFTMLPDFPVRPVLCDDNLSALPVDYQMHIIGRYQSEGIPLLDANSGFEPRTFDGGTFERWSKILRGPWRFGYDDLKERDEVRWMMTLLRSAHGVPPKKMQVYCMIGHEPPDACLQRIHEIIEWGGEPYCQRNMKLTALDKTPWVRPELGWTPDLLSRMARWANRRIWKYAPFREYNSSIRTSRQPLGGSDLFSEAGMPI